MSRLKKTLEELREKHKNFKVLYITQDNMERKVLYVEYALKASETFEDYLNEHLSTINLLRMSSTHMSDLLNQEINKCK